MPQPTIAIVGASRNQTKFGNKAVRAYLRAGWRVFPIHPSASSIEGVAAYPSVREIPVDCLDRISLYLPEETALTVLGDLASKPTKEVWFNPGADRPAVLAQAKKLGLNAVVGCSIVDIGMTPD